MYVPLNLATSIFGMNIEQLNGNGQHLRVFIITAVVALAGTVASWFVIEQVNSYNKWRRRSGEEQYNRKTQFSLTVRVALITLLVLHGYARWMFISGAWWRLTVNHSSRMISVHCGQGGELTACEYVSMGITNHRKGFGSSFFFGSETAKSCYWTVALKKRLDDRVEAAPP